MVCVVYKWSDITLFFMKIYISSLLERKSRNGSKWDRQTDKERKDLDYYHWHHVGDTFIFTPHCDRSIFRPPLSTSLWGLIQASSLRGFCSDCLGLNTGIQGHLRTFCLLDYWVDCNRKNKARLVGHYILNNIPIELTLSPMAWKTGFNPKLSHSNSEKDWLVVWVLWHINPGRLFNAKFIFIQIISSISNNLV